MSAARGDFVRQAVAEWREAHPGNDDLPDDVVAMRLPALPPVPPHQGDPPVTAIASVPSSVTRQQAEEASDG